MRKFLAIFLTFFVTFIAFPTPASAQFKQWGDCVDRVTDSEGRVSEVATLRCIPVVFHNVISAFLMFVGAVAIFMIIFSAIKLIQSGGDPKQIQAARQIMTYAIIGAILVLSSFAIIYFIGFVTKSTDCITKPENIATGGCK
jgi:uncharacterized membrane protein